MPSVYEHRLETSEHLAEWRHRPRCPALPNANAGDDLVPEHHSLGPQVTDRPGQVGNLDRDPVPAAGLGPGAVRHRLTAARAAPSRAEQQARVPPASLASAGAECLSSVKPRWSR